MYGKLFTQMYDGTLATKGPWQALVTFQQMIILADASGVVDMTAEAIARRTTVPLEIIAVGIAALEQPDDQSRTPDLEGRRIIRLDAARSWGWQIVNHAHYRKIRSQEERREYMRKYQREYRAKQAGVNESVNNVSNVSPCSKQEAVSRKQIHSEGHRESAAADAATPKAPPRKKQLPPDWVLPAEWYEWTTAERPHWTPKQVAMVADRFADHWRGKGEARADWQATWRNWVRREHSEVQRGGGREPTLAERRAANLADICGLGKHDPNSVGGKIVSEADGYVREQDGVHVGRLSQS
jgi:hypothetical protein